MSASGNYTVILERGRTVQIAVGPVPLAPLYWSLDNHVLRISVSPASMPERPSLNPIWISSYLLGLGVRDCSVHQSPISEVGALYPGHVHEFTPDGHTSIEWWIPPRGELGTDSARDEFVDALKGAVHARTKSAKSVVSTDLSGGADSGVVTVLSARSQAASQRDLNAITFASSRPEINHDVPRAKLTATLESNIRHTVLPYSSSFYFSHVEDPFKTPLPLLSSHAIGRVESVFRTARDAGSTMHLTGDGGDAVVCGPLARQADLLLRGKFRTYLRDQRVLRHRLDLDPVTTALNALRLIGRSYRRSIVRSATAIATNDLDDYRPLDASFSWYPQGSKIPWLSVDARRGLADFLKGVDSSPLLSLPGQNFSVTAIQMFAMNIQGLQGVASRYGLDLQFPYLDHRTVDAALAMETCDRPADGVGKPLLAYLCAREHISLPEVVLDKRDTSYEFEFYEGLRSNLQEVLEFMSNTVLAGAGIVDEDELRSHLRRGAIGEPIPVPAVVRTVAAEMWLRSWGVK